MTNFKPQNIYCVGRSYRLHALELGNEVPTVPLFFSKPTHAYTDANNQIIELPQQQGEIHFEAELILRLKDAYQPGAPLAASVDAFTIGLDLTLRDVQSELKSKGHPWLLAKGFRNSAIAGQWLPISELDLEQGEFSLMINDQRVQHGQLKDLLFSIPQLLEYCETTFGLGQGDILYTGTPAGVAALHSGDQLQLLWKEKEVGSFEVKLK